MSEPTALLDGASVLTVNRSKMAVHYSAKKSDWQTPDVVLERLGPIALDPCTSWDNPTKSTRFCVSPKEWDAHSIGEQGSPHSIGYEEITGEMDALVYRDGIAQDWAELAHGGLTFVNPPYGRGVGDWIEHGLNCDPIIYFLPARTDVKWFHEYRKAWDIGLFFKGRLTFKGAISKSGRPQPAPFPSMLLARLPPSGPNGVDWFIEKFSDMGTLIE